jgi:hypothetical protein
LGDPLKGNLLLFYKPLHLEAQQVSTRIEVHRHQPGSAGSGDIGRRTGLRRKREESERGIVGWVGLTDPDPSPSGYYRWWAGLGYWAKAKYFKIQMNLSILFSF